MKNNGHWLISVGELSGDLLGADLVRSLKKEFPHLKFSGIIGPALAAEAVHPVAGIDELNVMGVAEVVKKLAGISALKNWILEYVDRHQIRVAILVDSAGFHLKLAEELKMRGVYVIQYVAPKLWAWGERRVETMRTNVDLLLATFPFEESFFKERGMNCHYVGCPIVNRTNPFTKHKQSPSAHPKIALLPGSRFQELSRLLVPMLSIAQRLQLLVPQAEFVVPIASSLQDEKYKKWFESHKQNHVRFVETNSLELMASADVALVASGTATLECALVGTPLAVIYSMNPFSYYLAKKNVRVQWASLVNILRSHLVVREFIQDFDHQSVAKELASLLTDQAKRMSMLAEFDKLREDLRRPAASSAVGYIHNALQMTPYALN